MDYRELMKADEKFYSGENRAHYYDEYMKHKDWYSWGKTVPIIEVLKLFGFVLSWDPHFEGDVAVFCKAYREAYPCLIRLQGMSLISIDLKNRQAKLDLEKTFDRIANCTRGKRYESTGASKILHTIIPALFVMWDRKIREGILGGVDRKHGTDYVNKFLPLMQREARNAVTGCAKELGFSEEEALRYISQQCAGRSLAKLIDEQNYMRYTLGRDC